MLGHMPDAGAAELSTERPSLLGTGHCPGGVRQQGMSQYDVTTAFIDSSKSHMSLCEPGGSALLLCPSDPSASPNQAPGLYQTPV